MYSLLSFDSFFSFCYDNSYKNWKQEADADGDGMLSVDEYYRILKENGLDSSREEILRLIQMADKDNDG